MSVDALRKVVHILYDCQRYAMISIENEFYGPNNQDFNLARFITRKGATTFSIIEEIGKFDV